MGEFQSQRVGDRIRNLIQLISRFAGLFEQIDLERIWPIIEKIIDAIDQVIGGQTTSIQVAAFAALSNEDEEQLKAAGFDFSAIVQLIMLVVELLRSLHGRGEA